MRSSISAGNDSHEQIPTDANTPLDAKTYESLFEHMLNGVAYCKVLFDGNQVLDFIYLYTNPAFHTQTGLRDVTGKRVTEVIPGIQESDDALFQIYGRVSKTGKPETCEIYVEALGEWFALSIYSPKPDHFVAVFDVVTKRKMISLELAESENRLRHVTAMTSDLIYSCRRSDDGLFRIDWIGGNGNRLLGLGNEELKAMGCWRSVVVADDLHLFAENITDLAPGQSSDALFRVTHSDGSLRYLRSYATVEEDGNNAGRHRLYGALQDVTEQMKAEEAIRKSEMFFKESQRAAFIGSYLMDFKTGLWESSEVLDQILGIDKAYSRTIRGWSSLVHPDDQEMVLTEDVTTRRHRFNHEYRILRQSDSEMRWVIGRGDITYSDEGIPLSVTGTVMDITERKALEQRLARLAQTDSLTGLYNRGFFLEMAERELTRVRRYRKPMALAMLDLDHFKAVNDTYGHQVGDRVLKEFARLCHLTLRENDLVGRIGGEEFAILFPETTGKQAFDVSERLREAIAKATIPLERGLPVSVTVSVGLASFVDSDGNIDVILSRADQALYRAKRDGRNRTNEANTVA